MFADLLPVLTLGLHQLNQEGIVLLLPTLFGVVFESPVAAVAHLGIPTGH